MFDGSAVSFPVSGQHLDTRSVPSASCTSSESVAKWFDDGDDGSTRSTEDPRELEADMQVCIFPQQFLSLCIETNSVCSDQSRLDLRLLACFYDLKAKTEAAILVQQSEVMGYKDLRPWDGDILKAFGQLTRIGSLPSRPSHGWQVDSRREEADIDIVALVLGQQREYRPREHPDHEIRPPSLEHSDAKLWYAMRMDDDKVGESLYQATGISHCNTLTPETGRGGRYLFTYLSFYLSIAGAQCL